MTELKQKVIELLKTYPQKKRQIEQLRFELQYPATVSGDDLIGGLSLGGTSQEGGKTLKGHISDKTMMIALHYSDITQKLNGDTIAQITRELRTLEIEVERLEHYLSLLPSKQASVIQRFYFDGLTWGELGSEFHLSKRSLQNLRDEAISELARMYQFIFDMQSSPKY